MKLKSKLFLTLLLILLVVVGIVIFKINSKNGVATVTAEINDLVRTVSISGKVVSAKDVKLAFETSGTVSAVYKDTGDIVSSGDVLAALDSSETEADLLKARADLEASRAELVKIQSSGTDIEAANARRNMVQSIVDAYVISDDAIHNKVDQYFEHPRSPLPDIIPWFEGRDLENKINDARANIEIILSTWQSRAFALNENTYTESDLSVAKSNTATILAFLDDVTKALAKVEPNDDLTQTILDKYRSDTATARSNVSSAVSDLVSKGNALSGLVSDEPVREANVRGFEATVSRLEAVLRKTKLVSPINGIVALQDAEVGEAVQANTNIASVISTNYEVEAFVPEVSIAYVALNNDATITLDAYGSGTEFNAHVIHIDPAETVRDGVSTYKVRLAFDEPDQRIKSGMTANIKIETLRKGSVLLIPLRSVTEKADGTKIVFVKTNGDFSEREVMLGDLDSSGNVEVLNGLSDSDVIKLEPGEVTE